MRIMNAHSVRALLAVLVRHVRTSLGAHCANFATPVVQAATAFIADSATKRGSLQNKNVSFACHAARGIPRNGITPRGERQ
jgi:hypothetical protein